MTAGPGASDARRSGDQGGPVGRGVSGETGARSRCGGEMMDSHEHWRMVGETLFSGESTSDHSPLFEELFFLSVCRNDLGWFGLYQAVRPIDRKTRSRFPVENPALPRAFYRGRRRG